MNKKSNEPLYKTGEIVVIEETETRAKVLEIQSTGGSWLYTVRKEPWKVLGYTITRASTTICFENEIRKNEVGFAFFFLDV